MSGFEQPVDEPAVGPLDRDRRLGWLIVASQPCREPVEALGAMGNGEAVHHSALAIEDAHGVLLRGPVDPYKHFVSLVVWQHELDEEDVGRGGATARPEGVDQTDRSLVVDTHTHSTTFLPKVAAGAYHAVLRGRPRDVTFADVGTAGVHAIVAKAVGDPVVTRWHLRSPWQAVQNQLAGIRDEAAGAGARLVRTTGEIRAAAADGTLAVLLGLEGADAVGTDLGLLAQLARDGVRVIVPVHLGDNDIGTTCLPWQRYVGPLPVRRRRTPGLTSFGVELVKAMNELGVVVDGSHADEPTLLGMVEHSSAPVICSHAGARAVSPFERYLSDDAIRAVAATGGLVGLWPYFTRGRGTPTFDAVVDHARHVADLVGPEHLCLGTDMNGVPGLAEGYRGEEDVPLIAKHLAAGGFTDAEVDAIMGENFLRVLEKVQL